MVILQCPMFVSQQMVALFQTFASFGVNWLQRAIQAGAETPSHPPQHSQSTVGPKCQFPYLSNTSPIIKVIQRRLLWKPVSQKSTFPDILRSEAEREAWLNLSLELGTDPCRLCFLLSLLHRESDCLFNFWNERCQQFIHSQIGCVPQQAFLKCWGLQELRIQTRNW